MEYFNDRMQISTRSKNFQLTPIKRKLSPQVQTLSSAISAPPRTFQMITPNKLNSSQDQAVLFIANTSPTQQQYTFCQQTMGDFHLFTKRCIEFTEEKEPCDSRTPIPELIAPSPKCFAVTHNHAQQASRMCPTTNATATTTQTNIPGSINVLKQERINLETTYNQKQNQLQLYHLKNNIADKKATERSIKPVSRRQLKYSKKNDKERTRARNEINAIKVLRSNLPPLRVDENNAPAYAEKKYDVIRGAITYIKQLQRLLIETEVK